MPRLEKGQKTKLNVTEKARHRIMAGLSWDPAQDSGFIEKVKEITGHKTRHDLDLACYIFGRDGAFIEQVSGEAGRNVDLSEKIYHSGDNIEGDAEGDDEEISAELRDIPPYIGHLVFAALIRSGQTFKDIIKPEIRLADGYTNYNFLQSNLNHPEGQTKNVFVFARIFRLEEAENIWTLHCIQEYIHHTGQEKLIEDLKTMAF